MLLISAFLLFNKPIFWDVITLCYSKSSFLGHFQNVNISLLGTSFYIVILVYLGYFRLTPRTSKGLASVKSLKLKP